MRWKTGSRQRSTDATRLSGSFELGLGSGSGFGFGLGFGFGFRFGFRFGFDVGSNSG